MDLKLNNEQKQQLSISVFKSVIGFVPGGHIIDEIVQFRENVQQERLRIFSQYLKEGFENITGKSFDPEQLKTEGFIDTFEIIIKKVVTTKSDEKLKCYKNILLNAMYESSENEIAYKYIILLDELTETQVLILSLLKDIGHVEVELNEQEILIGMTTKGGRINMSGGFGIFMSNGVLIPFTDIQCFLYDLKSRGMIYIETTQLKDVAGIPTIKSEKYKLSLIGKGFLRFISNS